VVLDPGLLGVGTSITLNGQRIEGPITEQIVKDADLNLTVDTDDSGRIVVRDPSGNEVNVSAQYDNNAMGLITIPKDHLDLTGTVDFGNGLMGPFTNAKEMIDTINASGSGVTITASLDQSGNLATDLLVSGATSAQLRNIAPNGTLAYGVVADKTTIPISQVNLNAPLILNGIAVTGSAIGGSFTDAADVVASINRSIGTQVYAMLTEKGDVNLQTEMPGGIAISADLTARAVVVESSVSASLDVGGNLILGNSTGTDIRIGTTLGGNALAIGNGTYKGSLTLSSAGEVRIGLGEAGTPAQLAQLGLSTSVYIDGEVPEDLLVFVTGEGSGLISGSYDASMADPTTLDAKRIDSMRGQEFEVTFTSAGHYQISWKHPVSGAVTIVAERDYDPMMGIEYRGVKLSLNNPPAKGDRFTINGNQDGIGDNYNMLSLVDLEKKKIVGGPNGVTLAQAYEEEVGKIGNFASQAATAQKALEVVNNQAIESRDKVSGVSLDAEAADLIRFQQAYQAAAKAMQTSGVLFEAILQAG
jgi:flagellar hook-associated protein FlgK